MNYESCRINLEALCARFSLADRNEATTRLQLIDALLFDCLGWSKEDCKAEEREGGLISDYVLSIVSRILIVEAKREGHYFTLPAGVTARQQSLRSLCRDHGSLGDAIAQVTSYCQQRGVPFAAVSNGHQLVAFVASRSDGKSPLEGSAITFVSLEDMLENFQALWNNLSKPGIEEGHLRALLLNNASLPLPAKLSDTLPAYPGIRRRNIFQTDLQILSEIVLEDFARLPEEESLFLKECYASAGALSQYALVSKEILLARYNAIERDAPIGIEPAVGRKGISSNLSPMSLSRRPILLIGDVGVGKTSFIRNLIKVEAEEIFRDAISLYVDLGAEAALSIDLRTYIVSLLSEQLLDDYGVDILDAGFVTGVYYGELARFERGIFGGLRETDPKEYEKERVRFLREKIGVIDRHIKLSLEYIAKTTRKQVIIFIDNADQRDDQTQQAAFLIATEIAHGWVAMVYLALRPGTFHKSLRSGALSGYHPLAFTVSPPRIDKVIEKRLSFAIRVARGELPLLKGGVDVSRFRRLEKILSVFRRSLEVNGDLLEALENMASGNVRQALGFLRGFFGSGHVDTEKIVERDGYIVPVHEFLRSIIYGENEYFDPSSSPIANLFDISVTDPREHFLLPAMLHTLRTSPTLAGPGGFVEVEKLVGILQDLSFLPEQINFALRRSVDRLLVDATLSARTEDLPLHVRVTANGVYHLSRLCYTFVYFDAVVVDTPVLIAEYRDQVRDAKIISDRLQRCESFINYLDQRFLESQLSPESFDWPGVAKTVRHEMELIRRHLNRVGVL